MKEQIDPYLSFFSNLRRWIQDSYLESDISRYVAQIFFAMILGVLAGLGAVLFHFLLEYMRVLFDPGHQGEVSGISRDMVFLVPVAGAVIIGATTWMYPALSRERGVVNVIKSLIIKKGFIPLKVTVFHLFNSIMTIGTGIPLGPEGPAAKMGSGIGSFMSQMFRLKSDNMKMYTAAGAAAAISAVFNAPIAGVFFGIEVILLNDLKNEALSSLIISSVVADIISRAVLGNEALFKIPEYTFEVVSDFPYFLLLGIACGFISILFFFFSKLVKKLFDEKLKVRNIYARLIPIALVFGVVLMKYNELYGTGYSMINSILNYEYTVTTICVLLVLKIIFLAAFLHAGAYGGLFAPSLGIGVMSGFIFASGLNYLFNLSLDPVVFALVAMGGLLAGINSIPLTSMMLVFELTSDYRFILPLMLVSIMAYIVVVYVNKGTIYASELMEEGIDVSMMGEVDLLGQVKVQDLMKKDYETVSYRVPFQALLQELLRSRYGDVNVVDDRQRLMGVVSLKEVRQALINNELVDLLIAGDLIITVPAVTADDQVSAAVQKIEKYDIENIPVVAKDGYTIIGMLRHQDILQAYSTLLEAWETDRFLSSYSFDRKKNK